MTRLLSFVFAMSCFVPCLAAHKTTAAEPPKKVIFETDMCSDVDDVGALAMLHALADKGEATPTKGYEAGRAGLTRAPKGSIAQRGSLVHAGKGLAQEAGL